MDREALRIPILAMGKGWVAVDKPAGMSVHNDPGRDLCSLTRELLLAEADIAARARFDVSFGVNPVHRLDKETSGLVLLALTRETFRLLSDQFESRAVSKRYVAIVHGRLEAPPDGRDWGTWDWTLSASAAGRENPRGPGPFQESRTRYRVMDHSAHYTLVEVEPLTGRTHQIRRHAKLAGHPVVGDTRYGSVRAANFLRTHRDFDRLGLHARSLALRLPGAGEPGTIETPAIPAQMWELFQNDLAALDPTPA